MKKLNIIKKDKEQELKKVNELAREYDKKGVRVVTEPNRENLPSFMKNIDYKPDLIVYGKDQNTVIEVSSSSSNVDMHNFTNVADIVNKQENWTFELVMTNPKITKATYEYVGPEKPKNILDKLTEAKELFESGKYNHAAFLSTWISLESALRYTLANIYKKKNINSLTTLFRESVTFGVISRKDGELLRTLMEIRNSVIHGSSNEKIPNKKISHLINMCDKVLNDIKSYL